jgi:pyruvate dehydrogenase E2 component (dihydrolipoamide acetyltransferase)
VLARRRRELVEAARSTRLRQEDLEGGTFTITNLGAYGVDAFTPIINPPQVAILGVGAVKQRPAFSSGGIVPRDECVLSLTFDHRALDGAPAARFLADLADLLGDESRLEEQLR